MYPMINKVNKNEKKPPLTSLGNLLKFTLIPFKSPKKNKTNPAITAQNVKVIYKQIIIIL